MKIASLPLALVVFFAIGVSVHAQTSLSLNGIAPTGSNGAAIQIERGTVVTMVIANSAHAGGRYGLFAADGDNGNTNGWWLDAGLADPFPVLTGIGTVVLEGFLLADAGLTVNFDPDRFGSSQVVLDGTGTKVLRFRIPDDLAITTINLQAASQNPGTVDFEFSDAVTLNFVDPTKGARLLVSRDATVGDENSMEFGVLTFAGSEANGLYTPDVDLVDIDVQNIQMSDAKQWQPHSSGGADLADDIDVLRQDGPAVRYDNDRFPRISLPPLPGADGNFGTADDIPARDLLRCYDNVAGEGFFLLINRGDNPNTPGEDYHVVGGSERVAGSNPWLATVGINADGSRLFAVFDTSNDTDQVFLFSLDGSAPFGGNEFAGITPIGLSSRDYPGRHVGFTENSVFFVIDDPVEDAGLDADGFGNHLFTAPLFTSSPAAAEITIPATGANNIVPDIVGLGSLISSADGSTLVFLAGDIAPASPVVPLLQEADWYRVLDSSPTNATNFTQFTALNEDQSLPELFMPGGGFNGRTGFASLSPEGRRLAFVARHHDENGAGGDDDDEVYLISTNGAEVAGLLGRPVTSNDRVATDDVAALNNAQDLYLRSDLELLFFYGANDADHVGNRSMDLLHYNSLDDVLINVTATGGTQIPVDTAGSIHAEGYFISPNGKYLYFARGDASNVAAVNLVGVDLEAVSAFNLTGSEFMGLAVEDTVNNGDPTASGNNHSWQLHFSAPSQGALVYFASEVLGGGAGQEVWAFDADFPFAAFRLSDASAAGNTVETLSPNPFDLGATWTWTTAGDTADSDTYYLDLGRGLLDDLSESGGTAASALAGMAFIAAEESGGVGGGATEPALIFVSGSITTDNPTDAVFFYTVLDSESDKATAQIIDTGATLGANILQVFHASFD